MKKKFTFLALLLLALTSLSFAQPYYVNDNSTAGDVYTTAIGNDGNPGTAAAPFLTISHAISVAAPGSVIYVDVGTYTEHITINKSLTLRGPNYLISPVTGSRVAEAIINGTGLDCSVDIAAGTNPIAFGGFEFIGNNNFSAIFVNNDNVTISKNWFNALQGMAVQQNVSFAVTVTAQTVDDNKLNGLTGPTNSGIYYDRITNSTISNNYINVTPYAGIQLSTNSSNVTISGNTVLNVPQQGIQVAGVASAVTVTNNTINNANTSNSAGKGGIRLYGSAFTGTVTVTNNTVSNSFNGLAIANGNDITGKDIHIHSNNFANNSNAGVYYGFGAGALDATNNWWGSASGPSGVGPGTGTAVTANVTYDPWFGKNVSPGLYAVGISVVPNFTFTSSTTATLQVSSTSNFSSIVLSKAISPAASSYTFSNADLTGTLAGQYQLLNNTAYYWRIYNTGTSTVVEPSTPPPPFESYYTFKTVTSSGINLTTPSNASTITGGTIGFSWYTTAYGMLFDLQRDDGAGGAFTTIVSGTSDYYYSYDGSGLTPGATYRWRVISKTPGGVVTNYSAIRTFTMAGLPQPIISYPKATTVYETSPTLYWYLGTYNTSVTSYDVKYWRSDQADPGNPPVAQTHLVGSFNTGSTNMYATIAATLDAGYTYNFQIRSTNGVQSSSWSTSTWFTVYSSVPSVAPVPYPSWPVGGATSYINPPTLYWYLGTYATGLYFYVEWSSDGFTTVAGNSGWFADNLYFAIPTALVSGTYSWHVKSRIGLAGSVSAYSTTATFVIPSSSSSSATVPTLTYPTGGTTVYVLNPTLNWYAYSTSALEFQVRISTTSSVDGSGMLSNPLAVSSGSWTTASSMDAASIPYTLTAGALYYWQVRSRLVATPSTVSSWSYVGSFATAASSAAVVPMAVTPNFGQPINNTTALLSWSLPVRSNSHLNYDVEYSKSPDFSNSTVVKDIPDKVTSVKGLDKNSTYYWRVMSKNDQGTSNYSQAASFSTGTVTDVQETELIPSGYELSQNYPNPFNPSTKITYALPQNSFVTIKIYDMLGQEVKTLVSQEVNAGTHTIDWNADNDLGYKVASGMYVYRITAGNYVSTKKMVLLK